MVTATATAVMVVLMLAALAESSAGITYSSRLVHRFSEEVKKRRVLRISEVDEDVGAWPEPRSFEYFRRLLSSDLQRQKMKLGPRFQLLFPSEGSTTMPLGNDFGWLHYTWIDIGVPPVSFLVALDAGSDLLWVPCNCVQCAPLSSSYYSSLDKDLNEYNPTTSSTSKYLYCSDHLCESGVNCNSSKQPCPYSVNYASDDTSTSGFLVQDILHLVSSSTEASNSSIRAPILVGCGSKQTGGYLDGVAPDGLMGLGPGEISVPSFLARAGLIRNSFSLCFNKDDSGRIFFGDQGVPGQQTTPFLASEGKYLTYIVGVEACCIGDSCFQQTDFRALVDSGTSFTFLPEKVFDKVAKEFDREVNSTRSAFEGYPWQFCYKASSPGLPKIPSVTLNFGANNSFAVLHPVFEIYGSQGVVGFCLAIQPADGDMGTIGQNFMTGYQVIFDRENLRLGWSPSDCQDPANGKRMPVVPSNGGSSNPLPTTEQQNAPNTHAVSPAIAGRTPLKSLASSHLTLYSPHKKWIYYYLSWMLFLLHLVFMTV